MNRPVGEQPQFTVETCRYRFGEKEENSEAFYSDAEAREWAYQQLCGYASRVWINGVEMKKGELKV